MGKRLYKSNSNKYVDGVCGGIAEYLNIDPTLVRLIWAVLLMTGSGFVAYIICMIIIPREPVSSPKSDNTDPQYSNQ